MPIGSLVRSCGASSEVLPTGERLGVCCCGTCGGRGGSKWFVCLDEPVLVMKQCLGSVLNGRAQRERGCAQQHKEARRAGERLHRLCGSKGRKVRNAERAEEGLAGVGVRHDDAQGICARRGAMGARSYRFWWRGAVSRWGSVTRWTAGAPLTAEGCAAQSTSTEYVLPKMHGGIIQFSIAQLVRACGC